jgi:5'-deoxynucleotidase YfbR-like HD superfamily hydrolase
MDMSKPTLAAITHLLKTLIVPFYRIERDMIVPFGKPRNENDAEHSWSVAVLACSLAPTIDPSLDVGKIAQLALVHDLVEVFAGDTTVWATTEILQTKEHREKEALKKIEHDYQSFPWIAATIKEYEEKASAEATFVWAVDKFAALTIRHFDGGTVFRSQKITRERFDHTLGHIHQKVREHPGLATYYEQVLEHMYTDSNYFYTEKK